MYVSNNIIIQYRFKTIMDPEEDGEMMDIENEYEQYDQNQYYDHQDYDLQMQEYQNDLEDYSLQRIKSVDNAQYNRQELVPRIFEQASEIQAYTPFNTQWAIIYYAACGWKKDLCQQLIGVEQKHLRLIHYRPECQSVQISQDVKSECLLCCQPTNTLIKNLCGDQFCEDCWKNHIIQKLKYSYLDPYPPCINNDICGLKVAPKICEYFMDKDPKFKQLFINTLCRSYASFNAFVKICKGREGIDCNRCFAVNKFLDVIECDTCGNLVCPRCGEQAHGHTYCYDASNWKKITEDSTQFVEMFNYKICPNCKEAVERRAGCNSIICKCKQQFCFICGQKWLPNHSHHGDQSCYRYKEIMQLNEKKKQKKDKGEEFFLKVEACKSHIDRNQKAFEHIAQIRLKVKSHIIPLLLKHYHLYENQVIALEEICTVCMKTLLFLNGWKIALYFRSNELEEVQYKILNDYGEQLMGFILDFLDEHLKVMEKPEKDRINDEHLIFSEESKVNFTKKLEQKMKKHKVTMQSAMNMMTR